MSHHIDEPTIGAADAEELCAETYLSRSEAMAVVLRLRAAGWVVVEHEQRSLRRPDGLRMVASVYHPVSYDSPGDLCVSGPDL